MVTTSRPPISSLIGRDDDIEAVLDLLGRARLVTLTGPGGSGKTRLAGAILRTAVNLGRGAWFVDCSAIADAELIPKAIVAALDLGPGVGASVEQMIIGRLADREAILVLDNLEQIDRAGEPVARLLDAIPRLRILAASRRPLAIDGEHEYPVRPLRLPDTPTVEAIEASAAGSLFLERARARTTSLGLDDATAPDIDALLRRLDGLPLAIELAAARMRTMSPRELNARLDELGPGAVDSGDADVRRSLHAIFEWTTGQLTGSELEVLEAASACAGFDLELLQALVPGRDVLPSLEALLALGLVQRDEPVRGRSRYRVLLTIQAGIDRRLTDARRSAFRIRHADHFATLAPVWAGRANEGEGREVVIETDVEADNIRRAFAYLEHADLGRAARMLIDLGFFFNARGRWTEGHDAFLRLRERTAQPTADLVRAALVVADLIWHGSLHDAVVDLQEWAIAGALRLDDQPLLEDALYYRSIIAANHPEPERLAELRELWEARPPATDEGARLRRVNFEISLAEAADAISNPAGEALMREAIQLFGGIEDDRSLWRVVDLAEVLFRQGRLEEAEAMARLAVDRYFDIGAEAYASWAIRWLAAILAEAHKADEARDVLLLGAALVQRAGGSIPEDGMFWAAIAVADAIGLSLQAARYYGAVLEAAARDGIEVPPRIRKPAELWFARASRGQSPVAVELAVREGRAADPRRLLDAMPTDLRASKAPGVDGRSRALRHGSLTPREVEVLALVGSGRSDGDIAGELFISPKTASVHVSNVKSKLGVESRLEMALRARDMGLVRA